VVSANPIGRREPGKIPKKIEARLWEVRGGLEGAHGHHEEMRKGVIRPSGRGEELSLVLNFANPTHHPIALPQ
jgi:hypothetical protein